MDSCVATIFLEQPMMPDMAQLADKVGKLLGFTTDKIPPPGPAAFVIGASSLITGMMFDLQMPIEHYSLAAETATWWPEALEVMSRHKAFLTVLCAWTGDTRLDAHLKHTMLVQALIEQLPAMAVCWGSRAGVIVSADQFGGEFHRVLKETNIPLRLWIRIQLSGDGKGGTIASTVGMQDFDLMEIECNSAPMDAAETHKLVEDLARYLIAEGPIIEDGNTFGYDLSQRISVRHADSFRQDVGQVYLIDFTLPGEPKPGIVGSMLRRAFGRRN
jgi:hypothetical protein